MSQISIVSEILLRFYSHRLTSGKKAYTYLELATYYKFSSYSSKINLISSVFLSTKHPRSSGLLEYLKVSNYYVFHTYEILLSSASLLASLLASYTISATFSGNFCKFNANTYSSVMVFRFISNFLPVSFISFSQCLSIIAPFFSD